MNLPRSFYQRPTAEVAQDLLGKLLVRRLNGRRLSGVIVETEAYGHANDLASHACKGMTERNKIMFGEVGIAYVYFTYGNHHCVNVSARDSAPAGAVLIRSIEPADGLMIMKKLRELEAAALLTTGPGRLTQAMNITLRQNGVDVTQPESEITIEDGEGARQKKVKMEATARIGVSRATEVQWRFIDRSSQFLSRKARPASLQVK